MDERKITRFDITRGPDSTLIRKWYDGWTINTVNDLLEEKPRGYDMEPVLLWAEEHGWTVRRWPGGARAFAPDTMKAVRADYEIKNLRRRLEEEVRRYNGVHPRGIQVHSLDLAYDL